jgi:hypothetical protein
VTDAVAPPAIPTVVVFDYNWGGHIPATHRLIVESALRAGWRAVSLSGGSDEVTAHVEGVLPGARERLVAPSCSELGRPPARATQLAFLRWVPGGFALWSHIRRNRALRARHAMQRWNVCRTALERVRLHLRDGSLLFLPYLDDMLEPDLPFAAMSLPLPWAGLHMAASDLLDPRLRSAMEGRLRRLAHPQCRGLAVYDEAEAAALRRLLPERTVVTLPDGNDSSLAVPTSPVAQELERRAAGRRIVGLLGHLSEPKNLLLFLEIATAPRNRDLFFLVAGQYEPLSVAPAVRRKLLAASSGAWENVWALPNRIPSEGDFNRLLQRLDVVFAVYRDFTRSSGILTKAALFRRPILVASRYCMAERVLAYRLGLTAGQDSVAECEAAMRRLLLEGAPGAEHDRFARDFSVATFQARVADFLTTCRALPALPPRGP